VIPSAFALRPFYRGVRLFLDSNPALGIQEICSSIYPEHIWCGGGAGNMSLKTEQGQPHQLASRIPTPPRLIFSDLGVEHIPELDISSVTIESIDDKKINLEIATPLNAQKIAIHSDLMTLPEPAQYRFNSHGRMARVTALSLFNALAGGYDFTKASLPHDWSETGIPPSVGVVVRWSEALGGGTIVLCRYVNWLAALGCKVTVYSNDLERPTWMGLNADFRSILDPHARASAVTEPVVLVYSVLDLPLILQAPGAKSRRIFHLCQGIEDYHYGSTLIRLLGDKPFFQLLNSLPVGRIVVSPPLAEHFLDRYQQRCFTIPNGIDTTIFSPRPTSPPEGNTLQILSNGNPGQFLKGSSTLHLAVRQLAQRYPERRFHITFVGGRLDDGELGTDPDVPGVSWKVLERQSPSQIRDLLYATDIYVNASYYEGLALPTIEAMACGVPVVQTDNGGLDSRVHDGENCLLVPPANSSMLCDAIAKLMSDRQLREQIGRRGEQDGSAYSIERQFDAFLIQFQDILGGKFSSERISTVRRDLHAPPKEPSLSIEVLEQHKFSVLVPVYNHAHFLPTTLDTLRAQSCPHWEAIVVNDGSTDATPEVMAEYSRKDPRIKTAHKANGGTGSALNEALRHARHPWITWLSSDDFFEPDKLAVHLSAIEEFSQVRFFHTSYSTFDDETQIKSSNEIEMYRDLPSPSAQTFGLMRTNYVHGNTICIHRSVFDRSGWFDEKNRNAQDFDMWLRMSLVTPFHFIPRRTCTTRMHSGMGTRLFPEAGLFDSARSIVSVLNHCDFDALCPFLKKSDASEVQKVIAYALRVSFDPAALMYEGVGYITPLLDRVIEWLSSSTDRSVVEGMLPQLIAVAPTISAGNLPADIKRSFERVLQIRLAPLRYSPYVALEAMRNTMIRSESEGAMMKAEVLKRYFKRIESFGGLTSHAQADHSPAQGVPLPKREFAATPDIRALLR
jgi:glycosyltransferase involved in cell wall biosynthesis